jgi:hypothetical protein
MAIDLMKTMEQSEQLGRPKSNGYGTDFTHAFQIRTKTDGQNAGRKYILCASSEEEVTTIISHLNKLVKNATKKAAARTVREEIQQRVRSVYSSSWFQGISAFLIIAVGLTLKEP